MKRSFIYKQGQRNECSIVNTCVCCLLVVRLLSSYISCIMTLTMFNSAKWTKVQLSLNTKMTKLEYCDDDNVNSCKQVILTLFLFLCHKTIRPIVSAEEQNLRKEQKTKF